MLLLLPELWVKFYTRMRMRTGNRNPVFKYSRLTDQDTGHWPVRGRRSGEEGRCVILCILHTALVGKLLLSYYFFVSLFNSLLSRIMIQYDALYQLFLNYFYFLSTEYRKSWILIQKHFSLGKWSESIIKQKKYLKLYKVSSCIWSSFLHS